MVRLVHLGLIQMVGRDFDVCTSFRAQSTNLCDAMGTLARKLATQYVDPIALALLVSCRLIALDKCPGVRPIGVGEVLR